MPTLITRTTVRLNPELKKAAEKKAIELDMTFQAIVEQSLQAYLQQSSQETAKKIIFQSRSLGAALDNLDREQLYSD